MQRAVGEAAAGGLENSHFKTSRGQVAQAPDAFAAWRSQPSPLLKRHLVTAEDPEGASASEDEQSSRGGGKKKDRRFTSQTASPMNASDAGLHVRAGIPFSSGGFGSHRFSSESGAAGPVEGRRQDGASDGKEGGGEQSVSRGSRVEFVSQEGGLSLRLAVAYRRAGVRLAGREAARGALGPGRAPSGASPAEASVPSPLAESAVRVCAAARCPWRLCTKELRREHGERQR